MTAGTREEILHRLKLHIATMTGRQSSSISGGELMGSFDIDSVDGIELAMQMEQELGQEIDPEIFLHSGSSIDHIVDRLVETLHA
jgi:acyl carrier protein